MKLPKQKVLFVDSAHPQLIDDINTLGFESEHIPEITREQLFKIIGNYYGIIIRSRILLDKEMLEQAHNLRFIGRVGAGMENIDEAFAKSKNIRCFNSPEGNRDAVAEHAVGMLLAMLNHFIRADREVRSGIWNREGNRGSEIKDKTVAIIGYGNMGSAFAERLVGFKPKIIAFDKYKFNYSQGLVKEVGLEDVFEKADIVSLHVPLTDETHYMVNDEFISHFKKNIYLINTSRGKVLKTSDLVCHLKTGKILGAALDVLEYESHSFENLVTSDLPDEFRWLLASDKVILSPHIAGWTQESKIKLSQVLAEKIRIAFNDPFQQWDNMNMI
ncbi:MAG: NAD(P)-dependent oxidoreductase [Bacteroidota bacterium]